MTPGLGHKLISFILFTIYFGLSMQAFGSQATSILPVSVSVTANCSLSSAILNFGTYDPIGANAQGPLDGVATFQIACTKGSAVSITLNTGLNNGNAAGTSRAMSDGDGHYLSYELYTESSRSNIWSLANAINFIPASSAALTKTIYGRIPAGQNQAAGRYVDTVTITATF